MPALDGKLHETALSSETRLALISELWQDLSNKKPSSYDLRPYFDYYETQCHHALHEQGRHMVLRTHGDVIRVIEKLESACGRAEIKEYIRTLFRGKAEARANEGENMDNSLDLVVRLYLMVNVDTSKLTVMRGMKLRWERGTVKDTLASFFNEPQVLSNNGVRFEKTFNACNLERIAGIKICWTNNLADHLRMVDDDDKIVAIFHHATFLQQQTSTLHLPGLIDETLRTLALLFPTNDNATRNWFQALPSSLPIDNQIMRLRSLRLDDRQIETHQYWHDRLIILKQAFDEATPVKMSQWWYGRRNGYQWYTLWAAVFVLLLTVFSGLIQSVEGGLQAWKAFHPDKT